MVLALLCWQQAEVRAQSAPAVVGQQTQNVGASTNPTRPETQPRLDVDRDPIPSPDPEETAPAGNRHDRKRE